MTLDIVSTMNDQSHKVLSSLQKLNKMAVADVEKLVQHRMGSLQAYSDLYLSNLKAAAEVNDFKDLQAFLNNQGELTRKAMAKLANDAQEVVTMNVKFITEAQSIAQQTSKVASKPTKAA
jgi:phasin family protein